MPALAEVAPEDWDDLLHRLGIDDVYFRRSYLESAIPLGQGQPVFLHLEGRNGDVVFPALVRSTENGYRDVGTPMGYGGPVLSGPRPPIAAFFDAYERWCSANRIVSTFVRFHPLLANQRLAEGRWRVEQTGHTVGWRIEAKSAGELVAGMAAHHRRVVRKARAAGLRVRVIEVPNDLDGFVSLYVESMRRCNASDFYFFPESYWELLLSQLGHALVRVDALANDELVACIVCFASPPLLHYHLGASNDRGRHLGANHLLFLETASWASERGFSRFHLGGGVGGFEDSLYEFKRRFDPDGRLPATLGKAVHDADAYRALSGTAAIDYAGYFPAYRRPH